MTNWYRQKDPRGRLYVEDAGKKIGRSYKTVVRMIADGRIKAVKVLGQWRISEKEVERILSGN